MPRVTVVGDALLDVLTCPHDPIRPGADVPADIFLGPGGQGANIALRLARRGVDVTLVCSLADDTAGQLVRAALDAECVVFAAVPATVTGTVVILAHEQGERTMMSHRTSFAIEATDALRDDAAWLIVSGYLLLEPDAGAFVRAVAAHQARRVLIGCAVPDDTVAAWRSAAATLRPDLLILNRDEATRLDAGAVSIGRVVTHAGGARACIGALDVTIAAPDGPPAVDTTGAGDAFAAALVDRLSAVPWPPSAATLEAALNAATAYAGAVARTRGAQAFVAGERRAPAPS